MCVPAISIDYKIDLQLVFEIDRATTGADRLNAEDDDLKRAEYDFADVKRRG